MNVNGTPTWRNVLYLFGIFGAIAVGGSTLIMTQHSSQPHQNAVSQIEFARVLEMFNMRLSEVNASVLAVGTKLDRLIERE